jgi:hypothetical protein
LVNFIVFIFFKEEQKRKRCLKMIVSDHAYERLKNRTGLKKKTFQKLVEESKIYGIKHKDTSGSLKKYFDKVYLSNGNSTATTIYKNFVFVSKGETLITVFPAPHYIQKLIKNLNKKENENE